MLNDQPFEYSFLDAAKVWLSSLDYSCANAQIIRIDSDRSALLTARKANITARKANRKYFSRMLQLTEKA